MSFNWTYGRALAAAVFIMLVMLTKNVIDQYDDLVSANLPNPDSYYKLVLIKDYDPVYGFQYIARDNSPEGSWIHWSVPHTWTIMQLHKGLMLLGVDVDKALLVAGGGLTIVCMLLLTIFVSITVLNIGSNLAAMLSALVLATSFPLFGYGQLLQITHHIYMLVPLAAACMFFFRKDLKTHKAYDFCGGLLLGLAVWISPETMPLVMVIAGVRTAMQLQQQAPTFLWPIAVGLMGMLSVSWLIDPPPPTFQSWALDHISLAWLLFGALIAGLMLVADSCTYRKFSFALSFLILTVSLLLCLAVWLLSVPGALAGPSGLIPEELKQPWWSKIKELQSVSSPSQWVAYLVLPVLAGLWLTFISWKERQLWLLILALSTLIYGVLGATYIRMGAASVLISAMAFGVCVSRLKVFSFSGDLDDLPMRDQLFGAFIILLMPVLVFLIVLMESNEGKKEEAASCQSEEVFEFLTGLSQGVVMAPLNYTPKILFKTHHNTIAGNYHHNIGGVLDVTRFFRGLDAVDVIEVMDRRKVDYVAFCENEVVGSLMGDFNLDANPYWLSLLYADENTKWRIFRVKSNLVRDY